MTYAFLPDTSVVFNGKILDLIEKGELDNYQPIENETTHNTEITTVILSRVMLSEIENQANQTKAKESFGLEVLHELYALEKKKKEHDVKVPVEKALDKIGQYKTQSRGRIRCVNS